MKTIEEIKRGLDCCLVEDEDQCVCAPCPYAKNGNSTLTCDVEMGRDALAYIQQLERDNSQKDEHIMWLEMMNAEYKHVLGYIKHAADMGVHGDADALAMFGINMGRGAEEEKHGEE